MKNKSLEKMKMKIANEGYLLKEDIDRLLYFIKKPTLKLLAWTIIYTGRRISEVLPLKPKDIYEDLGMIEWTILKKRQGKVRKKKVCYPGVIESLMKFCEERNIGYNDYIFKSPYTPFPYSRQHVWKVIHDAGKKIGKDIHPHTLRHTYGIMLAMEGKSFRTIQDQLDHEDPMTTMIYLDIAQVHVKKELERSVPIKF